MDTTRNKKRQERFCKNTEGNRVSETRLLVGTAATSLVVKEVSRVSRVELKGCND